MRYHFRVHKEKDGFWGEGLELSGCRAQGNTLEELRLNLGKALDLYLSEPSDSPLEFPMPQKGAGPSVQRLLGRSHFRWVTLILDQIIPDMLRRDA